MSVARIHLSAAARLGEGSDSSALLATARRLYAEGALNLPQVGAGHTAERHAALMAFGRRDLSLARIVEAHTDAIAILTEGQRVPRENALYGVWASDGPQSRLEVAQNRAGDLSLSGTKMYCSGSAFLDAALVTAYRGDELLLLDVPLDSGSIVVDPSPWHSPAFAATATGSVHFKNVKITARQIVGKSRWYLDRAGFWHGAVGPAACWAGGAMALVDAARHAQRDNPHFRAHLGALEAAAWGLTAILDQAGREIDADPGDHAHMARRRALSARHLIERACTEIMDRFGRATGPGLLAFDESIARRYAELTLYIRQCHAERDLESLATPPGA